MIPQEILIEDLAALVAEIKADRLLDLAETAERLELERDEIRRLVRDDLLPAEHVGGRLVFRVADLIDWEIRGRLRSEIPAELLNPL